MIDKDELTRVILKEINYRLENSFSDKVTIKKNRLGFTSSELNFLEELLEVLENYGVLTKESFTDESFTVTADRDQVTSWLHSSNNISLYPKPILIYKDFVLNRLTSTLHFKNYPVDINLKNKPVIFLALLLEQPENIVSYSTIYEECLDEKLSAEEINSDITVKNTIKGLKKDLGKYLISKGLTQTLVKEIKSSIRSKSNQGYLLKTR